MTVSELFNSLRLSVESGLQSYFDFIVQTVKILLFQQKFLDASLGPAIVALAVWVALGLGLWMVAQNCILFIEHRAKLIVNSDYRQKIEQERQREKQLRADISEQENKSGLGEAASQLLLIIAGLAVVMTVLNFLVDIISG